MDKYYFHSHLNETLKWMGLENVKSQDILHIVDGYKGRGYDRNTQQELGISTYYLPRNVLYYIGGMGVIY